VTAHAIATRATVFVVLGGVQIVATTVILLYATKYASSYCFGHAGNLGAETNPNVIGEKVPAVPRLR